ncbi:M24 family metallopeptidase [Paenibacillus herberti]|uniref:Xaa-Pro dipeptidase n=1 Tax=Paenibacillus herberti TaxID=1619309 RepID=A0A229P4A2_9BACL|nr:Xaa-Pro peptidase family protein [Paenibacillus herberti]OXM16755.1 Xaa-Pro dipeptidase [Paenibacillus herberti]
MKHRLNKLREKLASQGLESLLIGSTYNRQYISGFTGSAGWVLVTAAKSWFLTDFRYTVQAAEQVHGFEIVQHGSDPLVTVGELLRSEGITSLGFEQEHTVYAQYVKWSKTLQGIKLVPAPALVEQLRIIKDETELAIMQEAADLADRAFQYIQGLIKPGMKESDVALELEVFLRSGGATSSCFDTIVASGERSALPHGVASDRIIGIGEFVKLDFGALYHGYCSDITRTVAVGEVSDKHREIYDIVLEAQLHALNNIRPGMTGKEADALARDIITKYGYGDNFGHSLGHGLGMEVHEQPTLNMRSDMVLAPGMVVTVEPGIYVPGFGGVRIEDDVVITDSGIRILTSSPKQQLIVL